MTKALFCSPAPLDLDNNTSSVPNLVYFFPAI